MTPNSPLLSLVRSGGCRSPSTETSSTSSNTRTSQTPFLRWQGSENAQTTSSYQAINQASMTLDLRTSERTTSPLTTQELGNSEVSVKPISTSCWTEKATPIWAITFTTAVIRKRRVASCLGRTSLWENCQALLRQPTQALRKQQHRGRNGWKTSSSEGWKNDPINIWSRTEI